MYSPLDYGSMVGDHHRVNAYARALKQAIRPGDVVIDIGAGTGIFSFLACRAGAGRVYAIEPDDAITVAKEIAADNGYADRITFIQDLSTRVTLLELADVVVSDLHGVLPGYQGHLAAAIDARERFLAPGGQLIPLRDILVAAAVCAPELYAGHVGIACIDGIDMRAAHKLTTNSWSKTWLTPDQLFSQPRPWALLDYSQIESCGIQAEFTLNFEQSGVAHGFGVWFESELMPGIELSNAPGAPRLNYGNAFFPWPEPVEVRAGDTAQLSIQANPVHDEHVWRWETRLLDGGRQDAVRQTFSQSTFFGAPLSAEQLRKSAPGHIPKLSEDGEIAHAVLTLIAAGQNLGEVANRIAERFPRRFADRKSALDYVSDLSRKYS